MRFVSTSKEIKKVLGLKGKKLAKFYFNKYEADFGSEFNLLVTKAVYSALAEITQEVTLAERLNGNTADSLAYWFDK